MVGVTLSFHIRQSAGHALSRIWFLRFLIHYSHYWQPSRRHTVLLYTFQTHGNRQSHRGGLPPN